MWQFTRGYPKSYLKSHGSSFSPSFSPWCVAILWVSHGFHVQTQRGEAHGTSSPVTTAYRKAQPQHKNRCKRGIQPTKMPASRITYQTVGNFVIGVSIYKTNGNLRKKRITGALPYPSVNKNTSASFQSHQPARSPITAWHSKTERSHISLHQYVKF